MGRILDSLWSVVAGNVPHVPQIFSQEAVIILAKFLRAKTAVCIELGIVRLGIKENVGMSH
jgi:hypothetical protein